MNLFAKGFDPSKLKLNLKLAIGRLKLLTSKKVNLLKTQKREIACLLGEHKEDSARIRVENVIREDYVVEALEMLELYCDLLTARQYAISSNKECTDDIKEAVCTLMWASERTEIPELIVVRDEFTAKYGKKFAQSVLGPEANGVSDRVIQRLNFKTPELFKVVQYLNEIAKFHQIDWSPSDEMIAAIEDPQQGKAPSGLINITYASPYGVPPANAAAHPYGAPPPPFVPTAPDAILPPSNEPSYPPPAAGYPPPPGAPLPPPPTAPSPPPPADSSMDEDDQLMARLNALRKG
mmetsp:Transcript_30163/g.48711  ORF Transcript_30163/g.48711 Transcript_30163/m.48711 type:complete len:293 (+) Transcript_30163:99-977(+)|eukprot:CAMPEP_0184644426 /NCGR_PEP_ID=MMETSP0308-20130426/1147_1 /TAXON_ID=38269 /ORGANISM="Gloeochaete witrockiana, Strain SAG 46.84" /LENGTH=292 /DNA_ID=CAMNT_0027072949 /DNA_START=94 /DNA_END=972 /DNA_ORIENTATION=+